VTDIVDEALFATLRNFGLKDPDARHLMYAVSNGCVRFVTTDPDFIKGREAIHAVCPPIRIVNRQGYWARLSVGSDHLHALERTRFARREQAFPGVP
jgi:hypothetical protein